MKFTTVALCAVIVVLTACADDSPIEPVVAPPLPTPTTQPRAVNLTLTSSRTAMSPGETAALLLTADYGGGIKVPDNVFPRWSSNSPRIVTVSSLYSRTATIVAVNPGTATITATIEGKTVSISIGVSYGPTAMGALIVESFAMIEHQYPSAPGRWYYAPQLRVGSASMTEVAFIIGMNFDLPGFDASAGKCDTAIPVAGPSSELFLEIYGEFPLVFGGSTNRMAGTQVTLTLTLMNGQGFTRKEIVKGAIVPGELPSTYTGNPQAFQCL